MNEWVKWRNTFANVGNCDSGIYLILIWLISLLAGIEFIPIDQYIHTSSTKWQQSFHHHPLKNAFGVTALAVRSLICLTAYHRIFPPRFTPTPSQAVHLSNPYNFTPNTCSQRSVHYTANKCIGCASQWPRIVFPERQRGSGSCKLNRL